MLDGESLMDAGYKQLASRAAGVDVVARWPAWKRSQTHY